MERNLLCCTLLIVVLCGQLSFRPAHADAPPAAGMRSSGPIITCFVLFGQGAISGTVTGSSGAPLKDVRVFAYTATGDYARDTSTNAAGVYTLTNLSIGSYLLSFLPPDDSGDQAEWYSHQPEATSATSVTVNANTTTTINVQLQAGNQFNLLIHDPNGNLAPQSYVTVFDRDGTPVASGATDNQGFARTSPGLPNGSYRLFAKTAFDSPLLPQYYDHKPTLAAANVITLTSNSGLTLIRVITLDAGARLSGKVTNATTGMPIKNAIVSISGANGQTDARSDAQGVYTMTGGLPGGMYQVTFGPADPTLQNFAPIQRTVTLTAPNLLANFDAALPPGGTISGTVTAPDGTPLADVTVDAVEVHGTFNEARTDATGQFTIPGLPSGQYEIQFHYKDGYIAEFYNDRPDETHVDRVTVTAPNTTANINAVLAPGGAISGNVADDASGAPLDGVSVAVIDPVSSDVVSGGTTDATGTYTTAASLRSGSYLVRFALYDEATTCPYAQTYYHAATTSANAARVSVNAPGTTNGINEFLEVGNRISGTATDAVTHKPLPDAFVIVYDSGGAEVAFGHTNVLGRYETNPALLPGGYRVEFDHAGYVRTFFGGAQTLDAATPITLPNNASDVNAALALGGSIAGRVTVADTDQPLERAVVTLYAADDRVVASTQTDWDGSYSFDNTLPSGTYWLGVASGQTADGIPFFTGYQPVFSGGASTLAAAQPINLVAPQTITVNLAMPRTSTQSSPTPTVTPTPPVPTPTPSPMPSPGDQRVYLPLLGR